MCLGSFYFEAAVLLRESIFSSSVLLNSETWVNLTKTDLEEIESCDRILLRNILEVPSSTPIPALYLELGVLPLRFVIKARRLMYLHYLLTREESQLVSQVLVAQINEPVNGDWTQSVKEDLVDFELNYLNFNEIKTMKK